MVWQEVGRQAGGFKWGGNGRDGGTDAAAAGRRGRGQRQPLQALLRWFPRPFFSRNPSLSQSVDRSVGRSTLRENQNAFLPQCNE